MENKSIKFKSLLMEESNGVWKTSVGRVSWWLAFLPALYIWISSVGEQDITPNHLTILLILATYNLGKKGIDAFKTKNNDSV